MLAAIYMCVYIYIYIYIYIYFFFFFFSLFFLFFVLFFCFDLPRQSNKEEDRSGSPDVTARGVVQRRDRQKKEFHDQSDYR